MSVSQTLGVVRRSELTTKPHRADSLDEYKICRAGDIVFNKMSIRDGAMGMAHEDGLVTYHYEVMRPLPGADPRYVVYLMKSEWFTGELIMRERGIGTGGTLGVRTTEVPFSVLRTIDAPIADPVAQRAIADYLDAESGVLDNLIAKKRRLIDLLQERIDAAIMDFVGKSAILDGEHRVKAAPVRRQLTKVDRPPELDGQVVTAFRDGQVTARSLRRSEGYTESWTDAARVQGVRRGDVVVHGLDGFAGAIGTSEADGVCSPVYHVCSPVDGGDAHFFGRMLRLLATSGYLGNFATSTRERAVDFRNWDLFGRIPIPVVNALEQAAIGDRIRRLAPIRGLVTRSELLIGERKQVLITAVVTGQSEIPRVVA